MKLKKWDWFNYIFASSIFAFAVLLLFRPWLNYFYKWRTDYLNIFQYLWLFSSVITASLLGKLLTKLKKGLLRLLIIIIFIIINIILLQYFKWSFGYFFAIFLLMVFLGLRFSMYSGGSAYNVDFGFAVLIIIVTLVLNNKYKLEANFVETTIIFISGISLSIFFNFDKASHRNKFKIIGFGALIAAVVAFLINLLIPGTANLLAGMLPIIKIIYLKTVDIFIYLIYPLIWIIGPIYRLIMNLLGKLSVNSVERPETEPVDTGLEDIIKKAQQQESAPGEFHYWWIYIILALLVIYISLKIWKYSQKDDEEGYREERESIMNSNILKKDLQEFFSKVNNSFRKNRQKEYDMNNPVMIIREIYYKFLCKYSVYKSYHYSETPNDYLKKLVRHEQLKNLKGNIKELTFLYNKARYQEKIENNDVNKAKDIWKSIKGE